MLMCIIQSVDGRTDRVLQFEQQEDSASISPSAATACSNKRLYVVMLHGTVGSVQQEPCHSDIPWSEVSFRKSFSKQHPYQMMFNVARTCKISCWGRLSWKHAWPLNNRVTSVNTSGLERSWHCCFVCRNLRIGVMALASWRGYGNRKEINFVNLFWYVVPNLNTRILQCVAGFFMLNFEPK
jgi:hypothetical protein